MTVTSYGVASVGVEDAHAGANPSAGVSPEYLRKIELLDRSLGRMRSVTIDITDAEESLTSLESLAADIANLLDLKGS